MGEVVKECIDSFIMDINHAIDWKYLKSRRMLKKQVNEIIFQIDFYSSKYNDNSRIEIRSECRVWCRRYDKSLTIKSGIANISFLAEAGYWWDIQKENSRENTFQSIIKELQTKVLPIVEEMEKDYNSGLRELVYRYGFNAFSNSIQFIDEVLGREEAFQAAGEYSKNFSEMERNILKRFARGECKLVNERNLHYMIENQLITV